MCVLDEFMDKLEMEEEKEAALPRSGEEEPRADATTNQFKTKINVDTVVFRVNDVLVEQPNDYSNFFHYTIKHDKKTGMMYTETRTVNPYKREHYFGMSKMNDIINTACQDNKFVITSSDIALDSYQKWTNTRRFLFAQSFNINKDIAGAFKYKTKSLSFGNHINRKSTIIVYDKACKEGFDIDWNRIEIRFNNKADSLDEMINRAIKTIRNMMNSYDAVTEIAIDLITAEYDLSNHNNLREFIGAYGELIINNKVLAALLKHSGMKSKAEVYLRNYKASRGADSMIDIISKADFQRYCKDMIKALKQYKTT